MSFYMGITILVILVGVGSFCAVMAFNKSLNKPKEKEEISKEEKE